MEKSTTTKRKKIISADQFKKAFIEHILMTGHQPPSVYAFANGLKSTESDFYEHFNSFNALERTIWLDWFSETVQIIESDEAYVNYSVREKLLAFYFTWLEALKGNRSFVLKRISETSKRELSPGFLSLLKDSFEEYIRELIVEGKDTSEIAERPFSNQYGKAFWLHFLFITRFWAEDDSKDFEKTDAAIEKSVNLAFDLVAKGPLDSMVDFAKFMFQNR